MNIKNVFRLKPNEDGYICAAWDENTVYVIVEEGLFVIFKIYFKIQCEFNKNELFLKIQNIPS